MNITATQRTAIKETAKIIATVTALGIGIPSLLFYLGPLNSVRLIIATGLLFIVKIVYDIQLAKAEREEWLAELRAEELKSNLKRGTVK